MQQLFKDKVTGEEKVARMVAYCARKDVLDEILKDAHSPMEVYVDDKDKKVKVTKGLYATRSVSDFRVYIRETDCEADLGFLTVVWREAAYINGKSDSAWNLYGKYEM